MSSFQPRILRPGLLEDGDVGVGVFPEREEIFVGGEGTDAVGIGIGSLRGSRLQGVCHTAVEQILSAQLGVHVNQDAVGSLSLAGVAGHGITVVEMRMLARIEFDRAATVHFQVQPPVFVDVLDGPQLAVRNFQFVGRRGELDAAAY